MPAAVIAPLIPEGLQVDTFQGSAWLGVMPFWMDRIKVRGIPPIPGSAAFRSEFAHLCREERTGTPGVFCLSLDSSNLLAVAAGRAPITCPITGRRCIWSSARSGSFPSLAAGALRGRWSSRRATAGWVRRGGWRRAAQARLSTS